MGIPIQTGNSDAIWEMEIKMGIKMGLKMGIKMGIKKQNGNCKANLELRSRMI